MSRRGWVLSLLGLVVAVGGYVAWEVFEFQTLFIDDTVNEAAPVFATEPETDVGSPPTEPGTSPTNADAPTPAPLATGTFVDRSHPTSGTAVVLGDGEGRRVLRFEGFETDNGPDLNVYLSSAPPDAGAGAFDDDFVDLGDLKGNVGDQNYEIPEDVDLERYGTVVVWCVRFSVAFGVADLA